MEPMPTNRVAQCPHCKQDCLWYGDDSPTTPCDRCILRLPRVAVSAEFFMELVSETNAAFSSDSSWLSMSVANLDGDAEHRGLQNTFSLPVKMDGEWTLVQHTERRWVDAWGNLNPRESLEQRLREARRRV